MSSLAAPAAKKRKATGTSPKVGKKLAGGIDSLMARLEAANASFLQAAAASSVQTQLAKVKASNFVFLSFQ
jgi:hypothetical protein